MAPTAWEHPDREPAKWILVVEDEFLIAMELARSLAKGGFRVLGPASTVGAALRLIADQRPDAAVLNVNLRGDRVTPVAEVLRSLRVPFVLASAYDEVMLSRDAALTGAPNVGRPTQPERLLAALNEQLERHP